ncbi:MAG: UTP--glucose-1-phosphate uridylyltransferase [Thermoguttaceae bacterium]|nr:UTP--glucose-1-phosphate uridylyltransferase [Thermoguttaceae bacterium]
MKMPSEKKQEMKQEILQILKKWNQPELNEQWGLLDYSGRLIFQKDLKSLNPEILAKIFQNFQNQRHFSVENRKSLRKIQPLGNDCLQLETDHIFHRSQLAENFISSGKAAIVILAGGMGSRLGHPAPKGTFPTAPVSKKSLFQLHFEKIKCLREHYGAPIRIYVMTNSSSHDLTLAYFQENNFFGIPENDIFFFIQNEIPVLNPLNGSFFFSPNGQICFGPDGHGGLITALENSGAGEDMKKHGIETLNTFHVDNPLVPVLNEQFVDAHLTQKSEMSTIAIEKKDPLELVGHIVRKSDNHQTLQIVEYLDFPADYAQETDETGQLKFWAGSIGIHLIQLDFLEKMARKLHENPDFLPYHLPVKQIRTQNGLEWGIKPERFIFDILPFAQNALICRAKRDDIFATLKTNSIPVRRHLSDLHASWLRRAGILFPANSQVEIAPNFAMDFKTLQEKIPAGTTLNGPDIFLN